ncbi:MAG: hypothetical protein LBV04_09020 [Deferribacteraceae bacterium]|jgi:protein involved in sex pheromone biosynthesis|nr:hypothetical protein [Deferribacteraceae bacterium]
MKKILILCLLALCFMLPACGDEDELLDGEDGVGGTDDGVSLVIESVNV